MPTPTRRIYGTDRDDILYEFSGEPGAPGHVGVQSNDELFGYAGNDTFVMRRDIGSETETNSSNTDTVHGGAGTDTMRLVFSDPRVSLTFSADPAGGLTGTLVEIIDGVGTATPDGEPGAPPAVPQFTKFDGLERFDIRFIDTGGFDTQFTDAFGLTLGTGDDVVSIERAGAATFDMGAGDDLVTVKRNLYSGWNADLTMGAGYDRLRFDVIGSDGTPVTADISNTLSGSLADGYSGVFTGNGTIRFSGLEGFDIGTGTGNDAIILGDGNDRVSTLAGNDSVVAGAGTNVLDGGEGTDLLSVDLSTQREGVSIDLRQSGAQQSGGSGSIAGFENFFGNVVGSRFDDTLIEGIGDSNATFDTGAGNDLVQASRGSDSVVMGTGNDRLVLDHSYANARTVLSVPLSGDLASGYSGTYYRSDSAGVYATLAFSGVENFTITTGLGNDNIGTGDGDDVIATGASDDLITVRGGTNVIDGGSEIDAMSIDLSGQASGVSIDLRLAGVQQSGGAGSITGVESFFGTVVGSAYDDRLTEGAFAYDAQFSLGAGNDRLTLSRGTDSVAMGTGDDRLILDHVDSNARTYLNVSLTGDLASGYSGSYTRSSPSETFATISFSGVENFTILTGGTANLAFDTIVTGDGNDIVSTGAADDLITVGRGNDVVDGGTGSDALSIDLSDERQGVRIDLLATGDQQTGGSGAIAGVESFVGAVTGSRFADTLIEGAFAYDAQFSTGAGNDTVQVSRGADSVAMGTGDDRLILDHRYNDVFTYTNAALTGDLASGYSGGYARSSPSETFATISFSGVENFTILTGGGGDVLVTGDGSDVLDGGAGDDSLTAAGGDDVLTGGAGNDALNGGAGIDTAIYSGATAGVTVSLALTSAQVTGEGSDTLTGIENLTGSAFADTLTGDANANALVGGGGDDLLDGGAGGDRMSGGAGDDSYRVDSAQDLAIELAGAGYDTVAARVSYRMASNIEAVVLTRDAAIDATGNALDNLITGNEAANALRGASGSDTLVGNGGADVLSGGKGADTMSGGAGDDTFIVDDAGDSVVERASDGLDTVRTSIDFVLSDEVENLVLSGRARTGTGNALGNRITGTDGADTLAGLGGRDALLGGAGSDTLAGGEGNDVLTGGVGKDLIAGGAGADRFNFADGDFGNTNFRADVITDFSHAEGDRISLASTDAIPSTEGSDAFRFVGTAAFSGAAGELRYQIVDGDTLIQADTDGDKAADLVVRLTGSHVLVAGDFVGVSAASPLGTVGDAVWAIPAGGNHFVAVDVV